MPTILENWKPLLGSLAAALVVILQIIQILIGSHIDGVLTDKANALQEQLGSHSQVTQSNAQRLDALKAEVARLEQDLGHGH